MTRDDIAIALLKVRFGLKQRISLYERLEQFLEAGIDVVSSEYATIAAENTAIERLAGEVADQIVSRIALYAKRTK